MDEISFKSKLEEWFKDRASSAAVRPIELPEEISDTYELLVSYYSKLHQLGGLSDEDFAVKMNNLKAIRDNFTVSFGKTFLSVILDAIVTLKKKWRDPRDGFRTVYTIDVILIVSFLAFMNGAKDCQDVADYYVKHKDTLMFMLPDMPPPERNLSHDTVWRALSFMGAEDITKFFSEFFGQVRSEVLKSPGNAEIFEKSLKDIETLYFDGQEPRSVYRPGEDSRQIKGAEIVGIYNNDSEYCEGFAIVDKKNNEGNAFAGIISCMSIDGKTVMADALNTSRQNIVLINEKNAFWLLPVKNNLGNEAVRSASMYAFNKAGAGGEDGVPVFTKICNTEKNHGRITGRTVSIMSARKAFRGTDFFVKYPNLETIVKYSCTTQRYLKSRGAVGEPCTIEMYFISSVPMGSTDDGIRAALDQNTHSVTTRWGEEGHMHAVHDNVLRQDEIRMSDGAFMPGRLVLNKIIYNILTFCRHEMTIQEKLKTPIPYQKIINRFAGDPVLTMKWFCAFWIEGLKLKDPPKTYRTFKLEIDF